MIKKTFFYLSLVAILFTSCQSNEYDTRAVEALDNLTDTIGELNSCSYTVNVFTIGENGEESNKLSDIYLRGPDKMYIENSGPKGVKHFWYNGKNFAYFLFNKSEYDIIEAPDNILKVIDLLHDKYGIDFPAADFLYPSLTDDIIENYSQLLYLGEEKVGDITYISIEAINDEHIVQVLIEKATNLPYKLVIESKTNENDYYEAVYSNWRINPELPDIMFEFQAPENATQVKFQSKK